MDALDSGGAV